MILGGKRVRANVPVAKTGDRIPFSITLSGGGLVNFHVFTGFGVLVEVLIKVPVLVDGTIVKIRLLDSDYLGWADYRYADTSLSEGNTHDIELSMPVHPGDVFQINCDGPTATEVVTGVIYVRGM